MKTILFISHDASRTGAPIVLLHFLKWLRRTTELPFLILLREGGELEAEFNTLAPTIVLNRGGFSQENLVGQLIEYDIGLIYSNTIVNGSLLKTLHGLGCPVISHIHELEQTIRHYYGLEIFSEVVRYTHHFIAASEAVKTNLVFNHHISEASLDIIHEFIPTAPLRSVSQPAVREEICARLGIPQEAIIVGGCGTINWRKGVDLFVQLGHILHQRDLEFPVHFVWVGGPIEGIYFSEVYHDVRQANLESLMHFVGVQLEPSQYFSAFDLFAMMSREDPFPLVCLEAASLGKPIVCFDRAGGIQEFVETDCGFVIPYLDLYAMATKIIELGRSAELRDRLGQRAQQKVRERHDVEVAAPKILSIIQRFFPVLDVSTIPDRATTLSLLENQCSILSIQLQQANAEVTQLKSQLEQTQTQLEQAQAESLAIAKRAEATETTDALTQSQLQQVQAQMEAAKSRIEAMESSKLWRLRTVWMRVKKLVGLTVDE